MRYEIRPIADEHCDSLTDKVIAATDDKDEATRLAEHAGYVYGAGILDTETGKIDVGFGFGVPCPDPE